MLSRADADVVRRDRQLPDLALLLDADRLGACLTETCAPRRITGVTITYLRYKPGESCLAACRADVDGQPVELIVKAYRRGAIGKLRKALTRPTAPGVLGAGRFALASANVLVSVFPNDAKIERLVRLMAPEALDELAVRIGYRPGAADRIEALRHNPERRFVGRLIADSTPIATVRCYATQDYAGVVDKAHALTSRGPLRVPSRLTRMHRFRLLAFEWLQGELLEDAIARGDVRPDVMELVGAALAHLHDQESPVLPRRTGAAEAAAVIAVADHLRRLHPPTGGLARGLSERLAARLMEEAVRPRPLHGDFYAKQVVLAAGRAALIDLDEASLGDPAIDLARFRADLEAGAASGRLHVADIDGLVEPLLFGYGRTRSVPTQLGLHTASQLVRLAPHPFRRREPGWPDIVTTILERAESFLHRDAKDDSLKVTVSGTERQSRLPSTARDGIRTNDSPPASTSDSRVNDPFGIAHDPLMPFLATALQPEQMAQRFRRTLGNIDSAAHLEVLGVSVTRYKPGLRCLIAYDLALQAPDGLRRQLSVMGKVRVQSADRSTHQLLEALWAGSFGAYADDGIAVPEPLGWIADVHMIVQRRVPGASLAQLIDGPHGLALARRAADAIHKLHNASVLARRRHTVDDEIRILHERLTDLARQRPRWVTRLERLLHGCMRLAAEVRDGSVCGIHRDFYPDQLLADGDRLYLTDLDLYREGHPALDVGNFVAHVEEYSLRRFGDASHLADRNAMLIERYLQLSGRATRKAIEIWTTLALARLVAISTRFAERRPFTEALLDLCERRVFGDVPQGPPVVGLVAVPQQGVRR